MCMRVCIRMCAFAHFSESTDCFGSACSYDAACATLQSSAPCVCARTCVLSACVCHSCLECAQFPCLPASASQLCTVCRSLNSATPRQCCECQSLSHERTHPVGSLSKLYCCSVSWFACRQGSSRILLQLGHISVIAMPRI